MRDKTLDVIVGIPTNGIWRNEMGKSLTLMFSYYALHRVGDAKSQRLGLITADSSVTVTNRHMLLKKACQEPQRTHLLFIDTDMEFPMNTVNRLLAHDKDVIACNCTTRVEPILPVAFGFDDKRIDSRGKTGVQKVRQVGAAVMLIRLDVARKLKPPFFMHEWIPEMQTYCGEDVYFCQLLQQAGVDVWIDHDLSREIRHIGTKAYGHNDVKEVNSAGALVA